MSKKHIYCFPGLGASTKIFEYINLPKESFELHLLEWKMPLSLNESIQEYAARISKDIIHENPVLVGVSFGGMIVQEISKVISTEKVIIISSIKTHDELPKRLKVIRDTRAYKLFPAKIAENIEEYTKYFFGGFFKEKSRVV